MSDFTESELHEIRHTLRRCGIEVVEHTDGSVTGQVGDIRISKGHSYYWIASGKIPLLAAQEMYASIVGKSDIRVNGHCMCPPPEGTAVEWITPDNKQVLLLKDKKECEDFAAKSPFFAKTWAEQQQRYIFTDDRAAISEPYITLYHIDSELGLYIFAETIKNYGLEEVK